VKKDAIYERAIYIIPYTDKEMVTKIQNAFTKINVEGLGIENGSDRNLNTKFLSKIERADRKLDILTGFELIDYDWRMYVFEGLSSGAMSKIEKLIPILTPNSKKCTILKDKSVRFQERKYLDFNVQIKRIKLRDLLEEIMVNPDIYLRTKVP